MKVVVNVEHCFDRTPDGAVWTQGQFARPYWDYYLRVFDEVRVVGRVRAVPTLPTNGVRANGDGVSIAEIPYYVGPWQLLRRYRQVRRAGQAAITDDDAVVLRVSSPIGNCMAPVLRRSGRPYGVEVVSDPFDVFSPGAVDHPLRPFFRSWSSVSLRRVCAGASAAAYVSERTLQKRYPPSPGAFATHYCDELPDEAFVDDIRPQMSHADAVTLISVGSLAQMYKAPDIVIDALAICVRGGLDVRLVWVGDGRHREELEKRVTAYKLDDRVRFLGQLPAGAPVRDQLDQANIFLLVSRAEALGRALIEAMARGLPCIGSTAGSIPELLDAEDLVPPGDAMALASKIRDVIGDPDRRKQMAKRNLEKAQEFRQERIRMKQTEFLTILREQTEDWNLARKQALTCRSGASARQPEWR